MTVPPIETLSAEPPLLGTDPDAVSLGEPFALEVELGVWVIGKWELIPKLQWNGWWIPHHWAGPGSRSWFGCTDRQIPAGAARFASLADASAALAEFLVGERHTTVREVG